MKRDLLNQYALKGCRMKNSYYAVWLIIFMCLTSGINGQSFGKNQPTNFRVVENRLQSQSNMVQKDGITWIFDTIYTIGKYANGDFWVLGPVTIKAITPDFDGNHNGWQVNPEPGSVQGFDTRITSFNKELVPSLPYVADAGQSIIKTISVTPFTSTPRPVLKSAAVLTVVGEIPPGKGSEVFRPPYVKTEKPLFKVADIKRNLIPGYDSIQNTPSLSVTRSWFEKLQMNHIGGSGSQYSRPSDNLSYYGADIAKTTADGALRLMVKGEEPDYSDALIAYLQCGLDYFYMIKDGWIWPRGGGEQPGEKLPIVFFVSVLGTEEMKDTVRKRRMYEDYMVHYGKDRVALYGDWGWDAERSEPGKVDDAPYWNNIAYGKSSKTLADPYGYIDGGMIPGGSYQYCCTSQPFKGAVLAILLMPELQKIWYPNALIDYVHRWVNFGTWTQPDSCAPVGDSSDYGITWGPDPKNPGDCIKNGIGRFPELHGTDADGGNRKSDFQSAMWDFHIRNK